MKSPHLRWIRAGLLVLAVPQAIISVWALLAPHSFFTSFPTHSKHWISALGGYNEHLSVDFGSSSLGVVLVVLAAAAWPERRLVVVALVAWIAWATPHFVWHLFNDGPLTHADAVSTAILTGFTVVLPLVLLFLVRRATPQEVLAP